MGDPITIALITTAVVSGGAAVAEGRSARRADKRARATERRIQDVRAARERRRAIREARVARAEVEAGAISSGTSTSSGAVQGAGAVGTQLASNLSFLDTVGDLQKASSIFREQAASHRGRASDLQAISGLASTGASLFAGKSTKTGDA